MIAAVDALPGVTSATPLSAPLLSGAGQVNSITPAGSALARSEQPTANFCFVGPEFFRTMGIAVLRGRAFTDADRGPGRAMPALVSQPTAQRLWPHQDPLGRRFSRGLAGEAGFEVVGVVADAKVTSLERTPPFMVYLPYWWRSRPSLSLVIKTVAEPLGLMPSVRRAIGVIDPEIAIGDARPLEQLVEVSLSARRYQMQLFVVFGAVALLIATVGVYAVTSYSVSQRRREMNIRVALGAQASQILGLVVRQTAVPLAIGAAAGAGGALAIGTLVASLLFQVPARDPAIIAAVLAVVVTAGLAACVLAARRQLVIDPARALRQE
jgi:putative ABC transport system permease protein